MSNTPRILSRLLVCTACGRTYAPDFFSISPVVNQEDAPEWVNVDEGSYWEASGENSPCECDETAVFEEVYLPKEGR